MVKSVVVSLSSGQESRSGSYLAITDQRVLQAMWEVCNNFNSGRCFYSKYSRRHVCLSCEGARPVVSWPRSTKFYPVTDKCNVVVCICGYLNEECLLVVL